MFAIEEKAIGTETYYNRQTDSLEIIRREATPRFFTGLQGRDETFARQEVAADIAARLADLEASDPSQRRPKGKQCTK